ncbi:cytochrome ubiquinol oxidase subunit I [Piscirickettsia salmonis]|uniref:cytochrome ubiquinol oxidase subunit I n=1 Tax=Piscirickettsia salmonis TaxID=1238 RepID=UPI002368C090|nr:cytochrome ubiquinol oxidase subunit I [Piscirickettsia salmonis]
MPLAFLIFAVSSGNNAGFLELPYAIPLPFLACLFGWFVAEHGRQPWVFKTHCPLPWAHLRYQQDNSRSV